MGWSVLQHRVGLSAAAEEMLNATDRLRQLLLWAGIPTALPNGFPELPNRAQRLGRVSADGPASVIEVRNRLVHPPKTGVQHPEWPTNGEQREAWTLALWYLELVILRVLEYDGEYASRLQRMGWVGTTEPVPWVQASP
jgi:hypothetical protein